MAESDPTFTTRPRLDDLFEQATVDAWRSAAEASLKGRSIETLTRRSHEGIDIPLLFSADDTAPDPGFPGQKPFVRGRTALGAGPSGWLVCPRVDHPDPDVAAQRAAEELGRGADAVWLVIDRSLRTASGTDEDAVGDGVVIDSTAELDRLVEALDPTTAALFLDAGGNAVSAAAALVASLRRHDINPHDVTGGLGCDPLGALAADGEIAAGLDGCSDQMAELVAWTSLHAPGLRAITVSTLPYHMAGASAVDELAIALATAVSYLRALDQRGIEPGAVASQLGFRHAVGRDLFIEAAKLRAGRRVWSRVADACNIPEADQAAPVHAVVAPRGLSTRDPWVNGLRTTVGAFAAAVGGADIITVLPFDAAGGPPDRLGRRIATNSQTILREESHLGTVVDPGGGSWYLEWLTDELATAVWKRFQAIERDGGMAAALLGGRIADELGRRREARDHAVSVGRDPITGVSSYPNLAEEALERAVVQVASAESDDRTTAELTEELARLFTAATDPSGDGVLFAAAIDAAASGAGIVRLADALKATRDLTSTEPLPMQRDAEPYERLRDASDVWLADHGVRPRVFLANMGPIPEHKPRAAFARNFFEAGGIESLGNDGFDTAAEAADAFAESGTALAVICSSDTRYPDIVPELARLLVERGARTVIVAGKPREREEAWRDAGVTGFIHLGCDQYAILVDLLREEGVLHV